MNVYVQSWENTTNPDRFSELAKRVESDFARFGRRIVNVDVLVIDDGGDDKGCIIEARLADSDPIAVLSHGGTIERAIDRGADKIERVIESRISNLETIDFPEREQDLRNPI